MSKLFSMGDVKNHPRRSGFDLSSKNAFTAKVGELLPVYWKMTMPGDKFTINTKWFTRTQPVNTAAYTRIREYFDWMYVPCHLLWRHFPEVVTQMQKNVQHAQSVSSNSSLGSNLPYLPLSTTSASFTYMRSSTSPNNQFGFDRADLSQKLLQYLNYGNNVASDATYGTSVETTSTYTQRYLVNANVSLFPLLAYNKFYQDWYRYSQWENSASYLWNIDYYDGNFSMTIPSSGDVYWRSQTMFDLKYCNWNKDLFMGVLPNSQYGAIATVGIPGSNQPVQWNSTGFPAVNAASPFTGGAASAGTNVSAPATTDVIAQYTTMIAQKYDSSFNILALRQSEALQRWKEVAQCSSQNYKSQIKAHFGVDLPDIMSGMSEFIDGHTGNIDITEVLNTNLEASGSEAMIAGKGISTGDHRTSFYAKDWGVLMCIYHAVPQLDYTPTGPDPQLLATFNTDLPIPELDNIGMESLPVTLLSNSYLLNGTTGITTAILGYTPRYIAYKTDYDRIHGAFTTTLPDWVAPISQSYVKQYITIAAGGGAYTSTYQLFKVNPSVVDSIFAVKSSSKWDTDHLLINSFFDVRVARNLDYDGMPY